MFDWITSPEMWIALTTLIALEIVLGIDNIIFIAILVGRLPQEQRQKARIERNAKQQRLSVSSSCPRLYRDSEHGVFHIAVHWSMEDLFRYAIGEL